MNKILNQSILFILGLIYPLIVLISYVNYDYNVRLIYIYLFLVILFLLFFSIISYDILVFINKNFILLILSIVFFHTFIFFTIFPIKFSFEYDHPIVTSGLFVLALIYVLLNPYKFKKINIITSFDKKLLFVISVLLFLSIFVRNYMEFTYLIGISKVIIFLLSLYFYLYFMPAFLEKNSKLLNIFIYALFILGFISGFIGIITVYIPDINSINIYPGLSTSFFQHPNANAFLYCYTMPCGFYILYCQRGEKKLFKNLAIILMITIVFVNQVLTFSRTGIAAVIIGSLIFLFYFYKRYIFYILIISSFILLFLFNYTTEEKGASTIIGRYSLLISGIETLKSNPYGMLLGYGINNNFREFENTKADLNVIEPHNYPHNSILFLALEFGILTVIFILFYYLKFIFTSILAYFRNKLTLVSVLTFSIVLSVSVQSFFEDFVMFPEYYMFHLFLIFVGLHHRFLLKDEKDYKNKKSN